MDSVDIRLRLRDARRFSADAKRGAKDIDRIGDAADRTKRDAREATGALRGLRTTAGRGLKSLIGVAAGYAGIAAAKDAVTTTIDLAKGTVALSRNLGFSTKEASRWAAVAHARGVDTDALSTSFTTLSKNLEAARGGSKSTRHMFAQLGIGQDDLAKGSKNFQGLIGDVAEGFGGMEGGAERATLAQKLLGRSSQNTLPIFTAGRKSLDENLKLADKYGVTLGDKPIKSLRELVKAQKEAEFAGMGLKVAFATSVAPALTKGLDAASGFFRDVRGEAGKDADFGELLSTGIEMAVPKIADAAGEAAPKAVAAFAKGWWAASPWGKLVTAGFLIHKLGGFKAAGGWGARKFIETFGPRLSLKSIFKRAATQGAATGSTAAASTMAGEGAGSLATSFDRRRRGFRRAGRVAGRLIGIGMAAAALTAFLDSDFRDQVENELSDLANSFFGLFGGDPLAGSGGPSMTPLQRLQDENPGAQPFKPIRPRTHRHPIGGAPKHRHRHGRGSANASSLPVRGPGAGIEGGEWVGIPLQVLMPNGDVIAEATAKVVRRRRASK